MLHAWQVEQHLFLFHLLFVATTKNDPTLILSLSSLTTSVLNVNTIVWTKARSALTICILDSCIWRCQWFEGINV